MHDVGRSVSALPIGTPVKTSWIIANRLNFFAVRQPLGLKALKVERSSRYLCSEGFITFISKPHDDDAALILAPYDY